MSSNQLANQSLNLPLPIIILVLSIFVSTMFVALKMLYNLTFHPLSSVPGPFFARALPFYPLYLYYRGDMSLTIRRLHDIHGEFVRIAPNHITIASPTCFKQISTTKEFEKGEFYDAFVAGLSKHRDLFTTRQNSLHSQRKRIHANAWSMTSVLEMEKYLDELIGLFMHKMGKLADQNELMDLGVWMWRYAYDVIGELFFGQSYGFLEQERDIDNLMATTGMVAPFMGMLGMAPTWFKPFMMWMLAVPSIARGVRNMEGAKEAGQRKVADRIRKIEGGQQTREDMLGKLLNYVWDKGEKVDWTVQDVEQECFVATVAGNDTVAITLTSMLYHLSAHPSSLARLQSEIDQATANGSLSSTISYKEAASLPYLSAVISEGFRIHPLFGYPVPRIVPKGGAEVGGRWWPAGTALGASYGTMEKSKDVFGDDVDSWRPERWLVEKERAARMWDEVGAFGIGQRACLGQHIARAEMMKIIPQFLREFIIEAASPWQCLERWFNKPQNARVKVTRRNRL